METTCPSRTEYCRKMIIVPCSGSHLLVMLWSLTLLLGSVTQWKDSQVLQDPQNPRTSKTSRTPRRSKDLLHMGTCIKIHKALFALCHDQKTEESGKTFHLYFLCEITGGNIEFSQKKKNVTTPGKLSWFYCLSCIVIGGHSSRLRAPSQLRKDV